MHTFGFACYVDPIIDTLGLNPHSNAFTFPAIASYDSSVTVVDSVASHTTAVGNGGFVFSAGTSRLEVVGTNVSDATGLLGGWLRVPAANHEFVFWCISSP